MNLHEIGLVIHALLRSPSRVHSVLAFLSVSSPSLPDSISLEIATGFFGCIVQQHKVVYNLSCYQGADWKISGADRKHKHLITETGASLYRTAPQFIASLHEMLPPRFHPVAWLFRLKKPPTQLRDRTPGLPQQFNRLRFAALRE